VYFDDYYSKHITKLCIRCKFRKLSVNIFAWRMLLRTVWNEKKSCNTNHCLFNVRNKNLLKDRINVEYYDFENLPVEHKP
jgi:hypothetical protein